MFAKVNIPLRQVSEEFSCFFGVTLSYLKLNAILHKAKPPIDAATPDADHIFVGNDALHAIGL